jgi:hypothetical protein
MRFESDTAEHLAAARAEVMAWLAPHAPEVDLAADPIWRLTGTPDPR